MAAINFFADEFGIQNLSGSGLGFYGSSFGSSVEVGAYQETTYITSANGSSLGPQVNNITYTHPSSGSVDGAASILLTQIPNYLATLNIRFTHSSLVKTQNAKLRIYDRSNINNNASGVTCKVAELIHPYTSQTNVGSGDSTWTALYGSSIVMDMAQSPGTSGIYAGNGSVSTVTSLQADWYAAISPSPDSIGSKTLFGLYFSCEYL